MNREFVDVFITVLCYLVYIHAVKRFCKQFLEVSAVNERLFVILFFCGGLFIEIVNKRYLVPYILLALLSHVLFMGLVLFLFQAEMEKKILVVSVVMTITALTDNFFEPVFSCIALFWLHTVENVRTPVLGGWEIILTGCLIKFIGILFIYLAPKHLKTVFCGMKRKLYVMLAVPLIADVVVIDVASWGACHGILVRSGGNMGTYFDELFSHAEFFVLAVLSMFATGFYVFGMSRIYVEQLKSGSYQTQIAAYKMLEEQHRQTERLRHDMKNHIIALSGLCDNKEYEKLGEYLRHMKDYSSLGGFGEITGNKVVDALLYQKWKMAESRNIIWECDVQIPEMCCIDEFDLCILFGNILDNALEACERLQGGGSLCEERLFVDIQAKTVKKCFLLEVKNSADVMHQYKSGFTDKENQTEHGIGLLNVSDTVHKYNGVMKTESRDGIFVISILIPLVYRHIR